MSPDHQPVWAPQDQLSQAPQNQIQPSLERRTRKPHVIIFSSKLLTGASRRLRQPEHNDHVSGLIQTDRTHSADNSHYCSGAKCAAGPRWQDSQRVRPPQVPSPSNQGTVLRGRQVDVINLQPGQTPAGLEPRGGPRTFQIRSLSERVTCWTRAGA